jgi:uncharacterized protein (DUF1778 family)
MQNTTTSARKEVFQLRLSLAEKQAMEKAAKTRGVSLAGFLREQALGAAKSEGDLIAA